MAVDYCYSISIVAGIYCFLVIECFRGTISIYMGKNNKAFELTGELLVVDWELNQNEHQALRR